MIYWCEPDPMPMLLTSLSAAETFNQMSFLSRRTTRPPFDAIVSSNYRCLPSAHRYYFCYYFVSPFTLSSKTTPPSILTAATAATVTATAAFARRGQCQQAHYRYVLQTYSVESDPLLLFFFHRAFFFLSSNSITLFTFQRFKTLLFCFLFAFFRYRVVALINLRACVCVCAGTAPKTCFGYRQSAHIFPFFVVVFNFCLSTCIRHCLNMLIKSTVAVVMVRFNLDVQKPIGKWMYRRISVEIPKWNEIKMKNYLIVNGRWPSDDVIKPKPCTHRLRTHDNH